MSVSTLVEMAARTASEIEGVVGGFDRLLKNAKVMVGGEILSLNDKVSVEDKEVFINFSLKVDSRKDWKEIAQKVQQEVAQKIREWGFPLRGVNVDISEVEWFLE
ncbi:MAG: Asp23/Gls24 family envelope stress response protein [Candidatus Atribacteria bacterium]|nr:Asp23/Gls24 family envelope stress response protein [Candidatus Atribacteria bacterium]